MPSLGSIQSFFEEQRNSEVHYLADHYTVDSGPLEPDLAEYTDVDDAEGGEDA